MLGLGKPQVKRGDEGRSLMAYHPLTSPQDWLQVLRCRPGIAGIEGLEVPWLQHRHC